MKKILLVEDDKNFGQVLKDYLELNQFTVELAKDGNQGYNAIHNSSFDICILDVMLPFRDGYSLAQELKKIKPDMPFIFLTAKAMKADTIHGFKLGADDFLHKPFDAEVLLYKLKAILTRTGAEEEIRSDFQFGALKFQADTRRLSISDTEKTLSPKEAELLQMLCNDMNRVVLRSVILERIWGEDSYFNGRSMDVYIAKLRKLLKSEEKLELLTVHGKGFRLSFQSN